MFFFRKKKVIVDCFTPFKSVYDFYKIDHARKFFPEKISDLNNYYLEHRMADRIETKVSTVKRCVGLRDLYKVGLIIPMWTDVIVSPKTSMQGTNLVAIDYPFSCDRHSENQYKNLFNDFLHAKLISPWKMSEQTGVEFIWTQPTWNMTSDLQKYVVLPGSVSYNYQKETHVNIMINKEADQFTVKAGAPMVHLIPRTDKEIQLKHHLISFEEYDRIGIPREFSSVLTGKYRRYVKEVNNNKPKGKCPFGFGK